MTSINNSMYNGPPSPKDQSTLRNPSSRPAGVTSFLARFLSAAVSARLATTA